MSCHLDTIDVKDHSFTPEKDKRNRVAVGNTMDYSGSMSGQDIADMEEAVLQFIRLKNMDDYLQIIKFHNNVFIMNDFTNDSLTLINAVNESVGSGGTAYYQAVMDGLEAAFKFTQVNSNHFPTIIAFTDGYNNRPPTNNLFSAIR